MNPSKRDMNLTSSLEDIIYDLEQSLNIMNYVDYYLKARLIQKSIIAFKKIIQKNHERIVFPYWDVLRNECKKYEASEIYVVNCFDGTLLSYSFNYLTTVSQRIYTNDHEILDYPSDDFVLGNPAIGQAWYRDEEVFSPREAINHSLNSTAKRIKEWAEKCKFLLGG